MKLLKFLKNGVESVDAWLTSWKSVLYNDVIKLTTAKVGGIVMSMDLQETKLKPIYDKVEDDDLVIFVRNGDSGALEYLINKYKNFVRAKARSYFLIGADHEDIVQEGMIGLYKAVRDFNGDKLSSFKAFAELCITRQIITAIKTATRQKHIPLNSYVSLDKPLYDEESDRTLLDVICGTRVTDPEELLINQEEFADIELKMGELLSDLERQVLMLYLDGRSYQEISVDLNRHVKSIDNALQRVKRKLERYVELKGVSLS
jgi:RNA polymerase sporulation-specific sigma factor